MILDQVRYSFANISKIKEVGFEPKHALEPGLRITRDRFSKDLVGLYAVAVGYYAYLHGRVHDVSVEREDYV
jgi:hypothetical protein